MKLADGTWLVGDHATGLSTDWVESEIQLADVRWRNLNIENVVEGRGDKWVDNPNLSRVEEIGFTDLMRGGGHGSAEVRGSTGLKFTVSQFRELHRAPRAAAGKVFHQIGFSFMDASYCAASMPLLVVCRQALIGAAYRN